MQRLVARVGFVLGSLACLAVLGASAAGAGREATPQPKNGGTLVIGLAEDPDALDPTLARTFVGRIVFLHMCEKLYDLNSKLEIVPQLASALPVISKDKLTYAIKIRSGIKFNDGTPLTGDAVKEFSYLGTLPTLSWKNAVFNGKIFGVPIALSVFYWALWVHQNLLDEVGGDGLDVRRVGELRVGHDRGGVGVDQHDAQSLRLEHPAGLGPGVVELARLPDDDGSGANHQDAPDVRTPRHSLAPPGVARQQARTR